MDHSSLLYQIRSLPSERKFLKVKLLKRAWKEILRTHPDIDLEKFCTSVPTTVLNTQFGRDAEDIYFTHLLSTLGYFRPDVDAILACILNRLVLELNFQTRFLGSGGRAEAFVLDGAEHLFPFAMANGNAIAGVNVGTAETLPEWTADIGGIDYQRHNLFSAPISEVTNLLSSNGRTRIGVLFTSLPLGQETEFDFQTRYSHLSAHLSEDAYHVISTPQWLGLDLLAKISKIHPDARVVTKLYIHGIGSKAVEKMILIITGITGGLKIKANQECYKTVAIETLSSLDAHSGKKIPRIHYYTDKDGSKSEHVQLKRPIALQTSSPLPWECRDRITGSLNPAAHNFPHLVYNIPNGGIMCVRGESFSSHLYTNGQGSVIKDLSDFSGIEMTPFYRESVVGSDGIRTGKVKIDKAIKIDGPVMPLTFTPDLHTYHSHFLLQCFPRVLIYRELMPEGKFIVPPNLRKKQIELLKMVGIDESKLVPLPDNTLIEADQMMVPHPWPLFFSPYTLSIYQEISAKITDAPPVTKRALISREQRTTWRNMLTYELVKDELVEKYGFTVIRPETLTLEDEINLYRNVEFMIGAEGAGLYSSVFSKPGATYISIGDEDYIMPVLASAAQVCGFDVAYAFGDSMRSDFDVARRKPYGHSDFAVSPATVTSLIDEILAAKTAG